MLLNDRDWVVRYTAVQRVPAEALACLLDDPSLMSGGVRND